ncbi:MAG TPA: hypothetical protein VIX86_03070 [Streptosporangiaceae bacterium]
MAITDHTSRGVWRVARQFAHGVAGVAAECHYAQRRLFELRLELDRYVIESDRAPGTFSEFCLRSARPRWREPAAGERASGAAVRPVASGHAPKRGPRR